MKKALILVTDSVSIKNPYLLKTIQKLTNNQIQVTVLVMILDFHLASKITEKLTQKINDSHFKAQIINWFELLQDQQGITTDLQGLEAVQSNHLQKKSFRLTEQKTVERFFDNHALIGEQTFRADKLNLFKSFDNGKLLAQYYFDDQQKVREVVHFQEGQPVTYEVLNNHQQKLYQFVVKPSQSHRFKVASDSEFATRGATINQEIFKGTPRNTVQIEIVNAQYSVHDYVTWRPYQNVFEFYAEQIRQLTNNGQDTGVFMDLKDVEPLSPYLETVKSFNY